MIYSTVKRVCDAGVCEQGQIDSHAALERDGLKDTDRVTAVWCLDNCGVPGTLWGLGHVLPSSQAEATHVLWAYMLKTTERFTRGNPGAYYVAAWHKLNALARGHKLNLTPVYQGLRAESSNENNPPGTRAIALMFYKALQDGPLNLRAVEVCEQAMLAATHAKNEVVPDTAAYKAEYKLQFQQLRNLLNGVEP
jgi:hypothetical protein